MFSFQIQLIQTVVQCLFAVVIYTFIVKKRQTTSAYILGYGLVIPLALYVPFELVEALDVKNMVLKLAFVSLGTIVFFRCIEAMHGTSPETVESSMGTYVTYYSSLMHFEWDPKTQKRRKSTPAELLATLKTILIHFHLVSLVLSFEMHFDFRPFQSKVGLDHYHFNLDLLSPGHLGNAYCLAILTYLYLSLGFELTAFSENVKGFYTKPIFLNPLFTSRSPSQFWGQKWNLMIHRILKYGAFLPARKYFSKQIAIVITFLASGLLHDYTWAIVFYQHTHQRDENGVCKDCFVPITFKLTAFFLWNGAMMLLERPVGSFLGFTKSWPTFIVSTLVLMTGLPVSHWYTGDWAMGGKYSDFAIGLWHVHKIS